METAANPRGQIIIPSKIRKQLNIKGGTHLRIEVDDVTKRIILTPVTREYIRGLRGKYKGKRLMSALKIQKKTEA
jgi:AbrB family looped-hinge helix DNA binding protein